MIVVRSRPRPGWLGRGPVILLRYDGETLEGADLGNGHLPHADLAGAGLAGANLVGADLSHADLRSADLRNADLRKIILSRADLDGAVLTGARMDGADLFMVKALNADLKGVRLCGAELTYADFSGSNLEGIALEDAGLITPMGTIRFVKCNLRHADFGHKPILLGNVDLSFADVRGANLSQVVGRGWRRDLAFVDVRLDGAIFDETTRWPVGFDPGRTGE